MEAEFYKSLVMTEKTHEEFKNSTKYWICKKGYEEGEVKVNDHDHITGKHCGSKHQECNLNLSLIIFQNLQNYDLHHVFQKVGKYNFKINVIPKKIEKYISVYYSAT